MTTVTQYVAGTDDGATAATKTGATYRILGSDLWADYSDGETVELDDLFGGAAWNMVWWEHSTSTSADGTAISSRGPSESDTVASWKTAIQDNLYYSFSYYGTSTASPDTSAYGAVGSDAEVITFTKPVSVTGVSAGTNQLTVSGGTWSNGNTVSADLAAGVGTVTAVDTTTNTIDYTLSGGRFIGGESKVAQVLTNEYGANGFHLPFTPGDLGKDSFGDNDWTPNNFTDATVVDSPTLYGTDTGVGNEVRGNYCVWNALTNNLTLEDGNLVAKQTSVAHNPVYGTIGTSSGKWYWELTKEDSNSDSDTSLAIGWVGIETIGRTGAAQISANDGHFVYIQGGWQFYDNGQYATAVPDPGGQAEHVAGTYMLAFDFDTGEGWVGKDGVWYSPGSTTGGDPANGTNPIWTNFEEGRQLIPFLHMYSASTTTVNFGQREFQYPAPAGFKTLNTQNL